MIQNFNIREYTAEFIGTFIMVFCGTGAVIVNDMTGQPGHPGIAVTFGLAVMAVIYAVGEISGAHINPAVTFGFFIAKKISFIKTFFYSVFQILGAVFASLILSFLFPSSSTLGSTLPSGNLLQSFILEIVLTFILMFVIIQVATGSKETGTLAGIAIGGTVALEAMFAGPISG
ncbi:MAG: aquaporin, partial [Spirochaetia bacterium]|nr:aquaporin [Spirochaetia bacterium]